jgi:hypothetical protein
MPAIVGKNTTSIASNEIDSLAQMTAKASFVEPVPFNLSLLV